MSYIESVKYIDWDPQKNEQLKNERGVSFEEVIEAIFGDGLIIILEHPNKKKYGNQKIFIVELHEYAYLLPYVEDAEKIFLKTVFPSRKHTKIYIEKGNI